MDFKLHDDPCGYLNYFKLEDIKRPGKFKFLPLAKRKSDGTYSLNGLDRCYNEKLIITDRNNKQFSPVEVHNCLVLNFECKYHPAYWGAPRSVTSSDYIVNFPWSQILKDNIKWVDESNKIVKEYFPERWENQKLKSVKLRMPLEGSKKFCFSMYSMSGGEDVRFNVNGYKEVDLTNGPAVINWDVTPNCYMAILWKNPGNWGSYPTPYCYSYGYLYKENGNASRSSIDCWMTVNYKDCIPLRGGSNIWHYHGKFMHWKYSMDYSFEGAHWGSGEVYGDSDLSHDFDRSGAMEGGHILGVITVPNRYNGETSIELSGRESIWHKID